MGWRQRLRMGQIRPWCSIGMDGMLRVRYSKYLTIWQKQPGSDWKFVADIGNGSPAPPPVTSARPGAAGAGG